MDVLKRFSLPDNNQTLRLHFDREEVQRLSIHARTSLDYKVSYLKGPSEPSLWLVADHGVYLISNGLPSLLEDGTVAQTEDETAPRFVAWAKGINPKLDEPRLVVERKQLLFDGSDGLNEIPVTMFSNALSGGAGLIEIVCNDKGAINRIDHIETTEADFEQHNPSVTKQPVVPDASISESELLELITAILEARYPDERYLSYWLEVLSVNIPASNISDLIFWSDDSLTAEEILIKAQADKPILL